MSQTLVDKILAVNRHMTTGAQPAPPDPMAHIQPCATPVVMAGGLLAASLLHPDNLVFEQVFRQLPQEGMFFATPQRNYSFTLGTFQSPSNMTLLVADYQFRVYRFVGASAGETAPFEDRRLSTQIGFDFNIDNFRLGRTQYQLDPQPPVENAYFGTPQAVVSFADGFVAPSPVNQNQFSAQPFAAAANPSGVGASLLPQRTERQGAPNLPFTYQVRPNQVAIFSGVVFKPVTAPIAFVELTVSGILAPSNIVDALLKEMKPCQRQGY